MSHAKNNAFTRIIRPRVTEFSQITNFGAQNSNLGSQNRYSL